MKKNYIIPVTEIEEIQEKSSILVAGSGIPIDVQDGHADANGDDEPVKMVFDDDVWSED